MRLVGLLILISGVASCVSLPYRDPIVVNVIGLEPLPASGLEVRLLVSIRVQNPNDVELSYSGAALDLVINNRRLASGVSDASGTVARYGEEIIEIPVTISAFDVARQLVGLAATRNTSVFDYRISGKLDGGLFGTQRFEDQGEIDLGLPGN